MELRQLRYFLTIAREGSYGRASTKLHIAQPALSRQIQKLEEELGTPLFIRHPHGISLTPAAQALMEKAQSILDEVRVFKNLAQDHSLRIEGNVTIGMSPGTAEILAYPLSQLIARRYPGLRCEFISMLMPARADLLRSGQMSLSVMNLPRTVEGLKITPLFQEPLCLIHHPEDRRFSSTPLHVKDLSDIPLILGGRSGPAIRSIIDDAFAQRGLKLNVSTEVNTAGACKALVKEGVGPTIHVAAMAGAEVERGELRIVPIEDLMSTRVIALPENCEITPQLEATIGMVRECMSNLVASGRWKGAIMTGSRAH